LQRYIFYFYPNKRYLKKKGIFVHQFTHTATLNLKSKINIIFGLQFSQLLRFLTFLVVSIFLTKISQITPSNPHPIITKSDIGDFELMMLLAGALSYFWVTGVIQSFLPLYNNNGVFPKRANDRAKSPEIFNTFLLLAFFSFGFAFLLWIFRDNIYVFKDLQKVPYVHLLIIYFFLNNTTPLIEYIYYVRNRPYPIVYYSFFTSVALVLMVCLPIWANWGMKAGIIGLIILTAIRFIWLLVLLAKYAKFKFSWKYIATHLRIGSGLIGSSLLSGSSQYIDGFIASWSLDPAGFAVFRYGAKELPFASSMSAGLNNGMLTDFDTPEKIKHALYDLKNKSLRLMHYLFPLSIVIMICSKWIYNNMFSPEFTRSADVFMVYLLMVISRMLFPQTILIGLKKTRVVFKASLIEIVLNIIVSILLIKPYGIVGIALGTTIVHILEKAFMIGYNYYALKIPPKAYIPFNWFLFYTALITSFFILIDHRILFFM
jgi:O-antigen/teichoic acid export membrane protein